MDYSVPHVSQPLVFVSRAPTAKSKEFVLIRPFNPDVWISIFVALPIMTVILYSISRLHATMAGEAYPSIGRIAWFLSTSLSSQGMKIRLQNWNTSRLVIACWCLFVILILYSYGGVLLSFIVIPELDRPIETIDQLSRELDKGTISCGTRKETATYQIITSAKTGILTKIAKSMAKDESNAVLGYVHGMRKALHEDYIYVVPYVAGEQAAINFGFEKFFFAKESFYNVLIGIAFQKNHLCRELLNQGVMRMYEAGITDQWRKSPIDKMRIQAEVRTHYEEDKMPLSLYDLQGAFFFLFLGYILAVVTLIGERLVHLITGIGRSQNRTTLRFHSTPVTA